MPLATRPRMVRAFVSALNDKYPPTHGEPAIQFEMVPVSLDQLIPQLLEGRGDLIAARMPVTEQRAMRVNFSVP